MKGESFASYGKTFEDTSFITLSYYCYCFFILLFLYFYQFYQPPTLRPIIIIIIRYQCGKRYSPSFCKSCKKEAMKQHFYSKSKSFNLNLTALQNRPKTKVQGKAVKTVPMICLRPLSEPPFTPFLKSNISESIYLKLFCLQDLLLSKRFVLFTVKSKMLLLIFC